MSPEPFDRPVTHIPAMADSNDLIVSTLRGRVIRGIRTRALRAGDRLPSAPELADEFGVDRRVVIAAYRQLAEEGLVERRPRGGVYVAAPSVSGVVPMPETWLADVLVQGLERELPGPTLHDWIRRSLETVRLRAAVVTATADQGHGIRRELRDDFGLEADALVADEVRSADAVPLQLRRADLLLAFRDDEALVRPIAESLGKPLIVLQVQPELVEGEWALLLRRRVYAVVATEKFGEMLRHHYRHVPGHENLVVLVCGRDDLSAIPAESSVYVTQRARAVLGDTPVPGHVLPPARTIAAESAREIFTFIVRANAAAISGMSRP